MVSTTKGPVRVFYCQDRGLTLILQDKAVAAAMCGRVMVVLPILNLSQFLVAPLYCFYHLNVLFEIIFSLRLAEKLHSKKRRN